MVVKHRVLRNNNFSEICRDQFLAEQQVNFHRSLAETINFQYPRQKLISPAELLTGRGGKNSACESFSRRFAFATNPTVIMIFLFLQRWQNLKRTDPIQTELVMGKIDGLDKKKHTTASKNWKCLWHSFFENCNFSHFIWHSGFRSHRI